MNCTCLGSQTFHTGLWIDMTGSSYYSKGWDRAPREESPRQLQGSSQGETLTLLKRACCGPVNGGKLLRCCSSGACWNPSLWGAVGSHPWEGTTAWKSLQWSRGVGGSHSWGVSLPAALCCKASWGGVKKAFLRCLISGLPLCSCSGKLMAAGHCWLLSVSVAWC